MAKVFIAGPIIDPGENWACGSVVADLDRTNIKSGNLRRSIARNSEDSRSSDALRSPAGYIRMTKSSPTGTVSKKAFEFNGRKWIRSLITRLGDWIDNRLDSPQTGSSTYQTASLDLTVARFLPSDLQLDYAACSLSD